MNNYINRILSTNWYPDICKDHADYKILAKNLHPDVNKDKDAVLAFTHLNNLKTDFERGYEFRDESGIFRSNYLVHRWEGDVDLLKKSKVNYDKIIFLAKSNFNAQSFSHFMQYIPSNLDFEGNQLVYKSGYKCIPLNKAIGLLPENEKNKHVNWIFSRLIEFVSMLESLEVTHAGINPDSVFIIPEIHGIKVTSFYHICTDKVKTINGKYKNYYPPYMFDTKQAGSYIDISLAKKTAICALGDVSGSGVRLRSDANVNQNVLNYLMLSETDAFHSMRTWRETLDKNFIKEFVQLSI
ncbi:MAG: hypothetical protein LBV71_17940 [Prevotella sp.]|jgi:hypothetical protein|nr:hypothetical protein [Prevotella sp.]